MKRGAKIVLFTDTFPYGFSETFLEGELKYISQVFDKIEIYPLFFNRKDKDRGLIHRRLADNVKVNQPLLSFNDKEKIKLSLKGAFSFAPCFSFKEFFVRAILGRKIKLLQGQKKASLIKRVKIFFNYLFIFRAILGDTKQFKKIIKDCSNSNIIYFYWGDKSITIAPFLKKNLSKINNNSLPKIVARFHGSDLYEGAKGYLPIREEIYSSIDYGFPVSNNGYRYIIENYRCSPSKFETCHLGSFSHDSNFKNFCLNSDVKNESFNIISCSNVIELKRIDLILNSLNLLVKDTDNVKRVIQCGYNSIIFTHFGDGPLKRKLEQQGEDIQREANNFFKKEKIDFKIEICFKGRVPHRDILNYYKEKGGDLFLLLSRSEGVPVSLQEAISYAIPIIATDVGGVSEIFSDKVGYLVSSNPTLEEIKEKILEYLFLNREKKEEIKKNCFRVWSENWNEETNYENFANKLLSLS